MIKIACNCNGTKAGQSVQYEVTLKDGTKTTVKSTAEARILIATSKQGGTYRAVTV